MCLPNFPHVQQVSGGHLETCYGASSPSHTDALRLQLATLRWKASCEEVQQRSNCEVMLQQAVELRAERRQLGVEVTTLEHEAAASRTQAARDTVRLGQNNLGLLEKLRAQQARFETERLELQELGATAVLEDDPDAALREMEADCRHLQEEESEWAAASLASGELEDRLHARLVEIEAEADSLMRKVRDGRFVAVAKYETPADVERLRREVDLLSSKVAMLNNECGCDVELLFLTSEKELPRLRLAEAERRKLQSMHSQALWERDRLERDFERVIRGLEEQEAQQRLRLHGLHSEVRAAKAQEEETLAALQQGDVRLSEMRRDGSQTDDFMQQLNSQLLRLDEERNALRKSLRRAKPGGTSPSPLANMGVDVQEESLQWLMQDRRRLMEECRDAVGRDESEAQAAEDEWKVLEEEVERARERNAELRLEASALGPLL